MRIKAMKAKYLLTLASILLLTACASAVNVDYDQKFDFRTIRTYKVADKAASKSGDQKLDNPFVEQRIIKAIRSELDKRGYVYDPDKADVRIVFHVEKRTGIESVPTTTMAYGMGPYGYYGGFGMAYGYPGYYVESFEEGILTIDIVENRKNMLIWRGSTSRRLYDGSTPESSTRAINDIVAEILEKFPPEGKK